MDGALEAMGQHKYVSLTTFRKTGVGVATAVWIGSDGDALLVTTGAASGKAKRIRNNPAVELRPCSRSGSVAVDATAVTARAEIVTDPAARARLNRVFGKKYGIAFRLFGLSQRMRRADPAQSIVLRITSA